MVPDVVVALVFVVETELAMVFSLLVVGSELGRSVDVRAVLASAEAPVMALFVNVDGFDDSAYRQT